MPKKFRVLFVCLGNICRSPAAEGVLRHLAGQRGLQDRVEVDSAGTGDWHGGDLPDARMRQHAARRGYDLSSRARQVRPEDFAAFDLILVMDRQNRQDLREFVRSEHDLLRVRLFCDFVTDRSEVEVPDPYYGGEDGFETVLDLVENGCEGILRKIQAA
jgi:protein-tyrosine phosphatase